MVTRPPVLQLCRDRVELAGDVPELVGERAGIEHARKLLLHRPRELLGQVLNHGLHHHVRAFSKELRVFAQRLRRLRELSVVASRSLMTAMVSRSESTCFCCSVKPSLRMVLRCFSKVVQCVGEA